MTYLEINSYGYCIESTGLTLMLLVSNLANTNDAKNEK